MPFRAKIWAYLGMIWPFIRRRKLGYPKDYASGRAEYAVAQQLRSLKRSDLSTLMGFFGYQSPTQRPASRGGLFFPVTG